MHDGEKPADMPVYIRGNPYAPGKIVRRGALRVASWKDFPEIPGGQSGRLQLADWLVDAKLVLTDELMKAGAEKRAARNDDNLTEAED